MKTLDRYIIRQYLVNFVILFVVLMLLFVLIDFIVNMRWFVDGGHFRAQQWAIASEASSLGVEPGEVRRLIDADASPQQFVERLDLPSEDAARKLIRDVEPGGLTTSIGLIWALIDYYGPLALLIYAFFSGLIATAAMGFTFTTFLRNRELTAMLSSGISMYRIVAPVVVAGGLLSAINLPLQELVIPGLIQKLTRDKQDLQRVQRRGFEVYFAKDEDDNLVSAARFDGGEQMDDVVILDRDERGLTRRRITADRAVWDTEQRGWKLENGRVFRTVAMDEAESEAFFPTELSPDVLLTQQHGFFQNLLSISDLMRLQGKPTVDADMAAGITRTIWSRFSLVVLNVLVLMMGLPFFMLRAPENMLLQSVKAAGVCVGAWAGGVVLLQFASGALPPVAASWLPVVIFLPISAVLLQTIKT